MTTKNSNITIVNNSGADLQLVHPHLVHFAKTGEIPKDIADLFVLARRVSPGTVPMKTISDVKIKVIVDFRKD